MNKSFDLFNDSELAEFRLCEQCSQTISNKYAFVSKLNKHCEQFQTVAHYTVHTAEKQISSRFPLRKNLSGAQYRKQAEYILINIFLNVVMENSHRLIFVRSILLLF